MAEFFIVILSFIASAILTGKLRWAAQDANITEVKTKHHLKVKALPTGAGAAIAYVVAGFTIAYTVYTQNIYSMMLYIFAGCLVALAYTARKYDLSPKTEEKYWLMGAIIVSVSLVTFATPMQATTSLPIWVEKPIIALIWLGFMAMINKFDTVDGLLPALIAFIAIITYLINPALISITLALAGALIGALTQFTPPAKAVMGYSGRLTLGFATFALFVFTLGNSGASYAVPMALLLPAVILWDTLFTQTPNLIKRIKGQSITHRGYTHQRAILAGVSHKSVIIHHLLISLLCAAFAVISVFIGFLWLFLILSAIVCFAYRQYIIYLEGNKRA